jgi:hypothetical protein
MNLDEELKLALARREPPPDFTKRVLARVAAQPARPVLRPMRWVAALAASLLLAAGTLEYRHYQGERAKAQVMLAMRIAASKLSKAQKKVLMIGHRSNS